MSIERTENEQNMIGLSYVRLEAAAVIIVVMPMARADAANTAPDGKSLCVIAEKSCCAINTDVVSMSRALQMRKAVTAATGAEIAFNAI